MFERLIEFFKELFNDDEIENNSDSDSEPEPKKSKKKTRGKTCRRTKISMKHSSTKRNRKLKK